TLSGDPHRAVPCTHAHDALRNLDRCGCARGLLVDTRDGLVFQVRRPHAAEPVRHVDGIAAGFDFAEQLAGGRLDAHEAVFARSGTPAPRVASWSELTEPRGPDAGSAAGRGEASRMRPRALFVLIALVAVATAPAGAALPNLSDPLPGSTALPNGWRMDPAGHQVLTLRAPTGVTIGPD